MDTDKVIYATGGDRDYVEMVLDDKTGLDITSDALQIGLSLKAVPPAAPTLPTTFSAIDPSSPAPIPTMPTRRVVRLLVGTGGTINPAPGRYTSWVRDNNTPTIVSVPAFNRDVVII